MTFSSKGWWWLVTTVSILSQLLKIKYFYVPLDFAFKALQNLYLNNADFVHAIQVINNHQAQPTNRNLMIFRCLRFTPIQW